MSFRSKPEAYAYALLSLEAISEKNLVKKTIDSIKRALEDHEQDQKVVLDLLYQLVDNDQLSEVNRVDIAEIIQRMLDSSYLQSAQEKFNNPLMRRLESELASELLLNPTPATMKAVKLISDRIIILFLQLDDLTLHNFILHYLCSGSGYLSFITQSTKLADFINLLEKNAPNDFISIMYIHYIVAAKLLRETIVNIAPKREPVGELLSIVRNIWSGSPSEFFTKKSKHHLYLQSYIANDLMYNSELYRSHDGNRGRKDQMKSLHPSNKFGIMLHSQFEDEINLPFCCLSWVADCKNQNPDLESPYVIDLIDNDAIYVSGFSGMTSIYLNQMEILGNFENIALKQLYVTAIASYVVGGGYHSFHEVLGPTEYALKLIPGYNVSIPKKGHLAKPPNYHHFFQQQAAIDPDIHKRRDNAWKKFSCYSRSFFERFPKPLLIPQIDTSLQSENLFMRKSRAPSQHEEKLMGRDINIGLFEKKQRRSASAPVRFIGIF